MAGASTTHQAPCTKTAWLKSSLSIGGDSSDASPQHEPIPSSIKIVGKKRRKGPSEQEMVTARQNDCRNSVVVDKKKMWHVNKDRVSEKHEGRNNGNGSGLTSETQELRRSSGEKRPEANREAPSAESIGGDREKRRKRKLKKVGSFPPRRRPHSKLEAVKNITDKEKNLELHHKDPTKVKAAVARQRRMRKLRARRIATGEHERLQAIKLKRQELFEMARLSRNQRGRMRKKAPAGAATEAVSHDEGAAVGPQAQLSSEKETTARERQLEQQYGVATMAKSALNRPQSADYKKARRQQRMQDALHVLGAELGNDGRTSFKQQKLDHKNDVPESDAGKGMTGAKPFRTMNEKQDGAAATSQARDAADTRFVQVSHYTSESERQEKPAETREQCQDTNTADEIKEEGEVNSPSEAGKRQDVDENTIRDEKRHALLDLTPIPRKAASDITAVPFMIPKRSVRNTGGKIDARDVTPITSADHAVGSYTPAALLFPASSTQLSDREPIHFERRRTKNPVPVKSSIVATQDQELMRVARRHNSIFLAVAELSANDKVEWYEVRDVDGKVFPDLTSRLNDATKHDIAKDKHSVGNSYFGVSLAVPKAKGTTCTSPTSDVHGDTENRTLNCYEMLRFERPEDREFYQRRMYGATFVPQHLCGRATLIMRTARFERKSTGVRFNQDRDREEFAASLGKRYTFKKSEPRCEIPRENWQRITKAQGGTVYLHYSNLEDAERASYSFRDDAGNHLELKGAHKHRVSSSPRSSPSNGVGCRRTLRRSYSSERSLASLSSQHGGTQQDRQRNVHRYSQYDRPRSAQREDGYSRYEWEYRSRSRSRSRSRAELFSDQQFGAVANRSCGGSRNEAVVTGSSAGLSSAEGQGSNNTSGGDKNTGECAQPESAAQNKVPPEQEIESGEEKEEGEIESNAVFIPDALDSKPGYRQETYDERSYQRQENYRGRPYEQQYRRRSRSRSRSRPDGRWDGGRRNNDWDDSYAKDDGFDSGRRTYLDEMDRHGERDYYDGEYDSLRREAYTYSRSYY